jgi:WD40 repeat protein
VLDLDISTDGRMLASGGYDATVRVWSTATLRPSLVLEGHEGNVYGVRFGPDGRFVYSTSHDRTLRRWSLATGEARIIDRFDSIPYYFDIDPSGRWLGLPLTDGEMVALDLETGEQQVLATNVGGTTAARFSPGGDVLAGTGGIGTLTVARVSDGRPAWRAPALLARPPLLLTHTGWRELSDGALGDLPDNAGWRSAVETSARLASQSEDGNLLCLVTWDGRLELWDLAGDRVLTSDNPPAIDRVVALPDGCVSLSFDGEVRVIATDAGYTMLDDGATAIGVSAGEILVATDGDVTAFTAIGELVERTEIEGRTSAVARIDGSLVIGTERGALVLREETDGKVAVSTMRDTPAAPVVRIAAGPAGTIAAGFANGEIGLWDLATGTSLLSARLHGSIDHLAATGAGLVAASEFGQLVNWDLTVLVEPREELLASIRSASPALWQDGRPVVR